MSPRWRSADRRCAGEGIDPAQEGLHPSHELAHAERLRQVVVGADGQADDEVGLVVAGGEHQHRDVAVLLDAAAHLQAVEAREHQVEEHQVGVQERRQVDAREAVAGHVTS